MKKGKTCIALLLSGFVFASASLPFTETVSASNKPPECGPQVVAQRMAADWGVGKNDIETYLQQGVNPHDLMHGAILAKASNKPLTEILSMKTLANTWDDVEQSLGITKQQIQGIREDMVATKMANDLSVAKSTIVDLLKYGYIPPDIDAAAVLAKSTQKPILEILSLKKINNSWSDVAQSLGIDQDTFRQTLEKHHGFMSGPGMHGPDNGHPGPAMDGMYGGPDIP